MCINTSMALKDAILETLSCMLSGNNELRKIAEERKKALEVAEEYPLYLLEIMLTNEEATEERQMACVLFKQFIKHHWTKRDSYVSINASIRSKIKTILPMGLGDPLPKIRLATAHSLALLVQYEYPHNWIELMDMILLKLKSNTYTEVVGVITFLEECSRLLTLEVLSMMAPSLYNDLFSLCQNDMYPVQVQILLIQVITKLLYSNMCSKPNYDTFAATVNNFIMLFGMQLTKPYNANNDFKLKSEIFRTFQDLVTMMDDIALQPIMSLLPTIFNLLQRCCSDYIQIIMDISIYPNDDDEEKNTLGSYDNLVDSIYSFISCLVAVEESPQYLYSVLPELIYSIVLFMTITPKIEEMWREDEVNMYMDDCEDMVLNNIRTVMRNLLKAISYHYDKAKFVSALNNAIEKHSSSANHLKAESEAYWWRMHECLMYAVGNVSEVLREPNVEFRDLSNYLVQWSDFMNMCNVDLVVGRIIWVGGKFSHLLDRQYTEKHIGAILEHLKSNHHVSKVLALRALYFHCEEFRISNNVNVFKDKLNDLLDCLLNMGSPSHGVAALILDCMCHMVNLDKNLTSRNSSRVVPFIMTTFLRNISNNTIMHKVLMLVSILSRNLSMIVPMQLEFLPLFVNVIQQPASAAYEATDIRSVTVDILTCFVTFAQTPLNNTLIEQGFMTIVRNMHMFNEIPLLQSSARCLTAFLTQAPEEISHFREHDRHRGVELIMSIVSFFLNPSRQGCASNVVGKLIIACIKAMGPFIDTHIKTILKDVLTKMHNAFIKDYDDSIVIAFVFTFYQHYDATVNLLSIIPGPDGGSALQFVLCRWIEMYEDFTETYDKNLNIMAFIQILERAIMNDDQRVLKIKVVHQHTEIPILVKIFKILIKILYEELQERKEQPRQACNAGFNQSIMYHNTEYLKIENSLINPLEARDPIYYMKIDYLFEFLGKLVHYPYYCTILNHTNQMERNVIGSLGFLSQPAAS